MVKGYRLYGAILILVVAAFAIVVGSATAFGAPGGHNQGRGDQAIHGLLTPTVTGTPTPCTGWDVVASPNITTTTQGNYLQAVSAGAANDVWAVGYYVTPDFHQRTLVEHWNGSSWSIMPSTNPGSINNVLFGVAALPNGEAWAVGRFNNTSIQNTLIEHCTSAGCTDVTSPNGPGSNVLFGVAAISANDVWAVGQDCDRPLCTTRTTLTLHYTNSSWNVVQSPNVGTDFNGLFGVVGSASDNVWAVGQACQDAGCNTSLALILHYDATQSWSVAGTFGPTGMYTTLNGVAVQGANDAWAVGQTCTDGSCVASTSYTLHYASGTWTEVPSPNPGAMDTHLNAVAIAGPSDAWAVGSATNNGSYYFNPVLHWDGVHWTAVTVASPGTADNDLRGLAAVSANDMWAVGDMDSGSGELTQIQHYTGPCGAATPTATQTSTATATGTATGTAIATATVPAGTPTTTPTVCTINFSDVQPSDYFYQDVRCVYCLGAVSGYADGTFRPFNNTTRGQMTKIIVIALRIPVATPTGTPTFNDVPTGNAFYTYVETAAAGGIVSGYNCGGPGEPCPGLYFRPNANVTRGQLSKIVVVAANHAYGWGILNPTLPTFVDVPPGSPFYTYIETASCHGVISGYADHTFRPGNNAIRAQIAKIVCRTSQNPASTCPAPPTATPTAVAAP